MVLLNTPQSHPESRPCATYVNSIKAGGATARVYNCVCILTSALIEVSLLTAKVMILPAST